MFRSLFRGRNEDFQGKVLRLARRLYPHRQFEIADRAEGTIRSGEIIIGLQNLEAKFRLSDRSDRMLEELVAAHLRIVFLTPEDNSSLESVRAHLRPQIMPLEYLEVSPLVSASFAENLALGVVVDAEDGYSYVKQEDADRWRLTFEEILALSVENLNGASRGLQMQSGVGDGSKWIAIEEKDGYDASRILIPELRAFLGGRLGMPFRFGIPNRDFLICWNADASPKFAAFSAGKIRKDFEAQPYPLSADIFEMDATGSVKVVT